MTTQTTTTPKKNRRVLKSVPVPTTPPGELHSIDATAKLLNMTPQYVRTLIRRGVLRSYKFPTTPEAAMFKHMIHTDDIAAFQSDPSRKTKRSDGRTKYIFYATDVEFEASLEALRLNNLAHLVPFFRTANSLKPKE